MFKGIILPDWHGKTAAGKASAVAVEIGNDWIKIAEARSGSGNKEITKLRFLKLAQIEGLVENAISKAFNELGLNRRGVATYIPRHLVTVKMLDLPSTDVKEIANMIGLQASKQTPYSKEEIIFGYRTIGSRREGYTTVMLVIARRSIVEERVKVLNKAGIEVGGVTFSSEGLLRWFEAAYPEEIKSTRAVPIALLDIDANYSDFAVIQNEKLSFTRSIFIGANNLMDETAGWLEKFVAEARHSMERYYTECQDGKISRMILTGAAVNIAGLDAAVGASIGVGAESVNSFKNIDSGTGADIFKDPAYRGISVTPLFGMLASSGKGEADLTPSEVRIKKTMEAKRNNLVTTGILSTAIVTMSCILAMTVLHNKNLYLTQLKAKNAEIEKDAGEIEKTRMRIEMVDKRREAKGSSIELLAEVHRLTPKEIYLYSIAVEERKKVVLKGRALAMSEVFKYITALEESDMFANVKTTYTTTKKEQNGEYAEFEVVGLYEG